MNGDNEDRDLLGETEPASGKDESGAVRPGVRTWVQDAIAAPDLDGHLLGATEIGTNPNRAGQGVRGELAGARPEAESLPPGLVVGDFEIVARLGSGGMGVVYEAVDTQMGKDDRVALKFLRTQLSRNAEVVGAFKNEVRATQRLKDGHIIQVRKFHSVAGYYFMEMELVRGCALGLLEKVLFDGGGSLPVGWACRVACDALSGLKYAHVEGIVHRDLKPSNLILKGLAPTRTVPAIPPAVVICDFGIASEVARVATTVLSAGTAYYSAPEVVERRGSVDGRADVFSVGVVLYEMLAGRKPQGNYPRLYETRGDIPAPVSDAVDCALRIEPAARWATAGQFLQALAPFRVTGISGNGVSGPTFDPKPAQVGDSKWVTRSWDGRSQPSDTPLSNGRRFDSALDKVLRRARDGEKK